MWGGRDGDGGKMSFCITHTSLNPNFPVFVRGLEVMIHVTCNVCRSAAVESGGDGPR
jgi:hypothetical protein